MVENLSFSGIARLVGCTLLYLVLTLLFSLLEKNEKYFKFNALIKQIIIGICFGIVSIFSTVYGVSAGSAVINVRDAGPLCAGFLFGGFSGVVAGVIGGTFRWLASALISAEYTTLACSLSTFLAGIFSALMVKTIFDERHPSALAGFGIGATMEVLHMLLILVTNNYNITYAFFFVQECTIPMVLCNGIALFGSIITYDVAKGNVHKKRKKKRISEEFGISLLIVVVVALIFTSFFTQRIVYEVSTVATAYIKEVIAYLVAFMEVLIYTALFILIYQLIRKKIVVNLQHVNKDLKKIQHGELDTYVDVRAYAEFSELSDYINDTVNTLKLFINEAENRVKQELELATKIQYSSLPHTFPKRDDIELYASMKPAKEVGGDFYDFYMIDSYNYVFLIADVSGKGFPAALFMMTAKTMLKDLMERGYSTDEAFVKANERLYKSNDAEMFLTSWMGKLDLRTGKITYSNAGHNHPIVIRNDGTVEYLVTKPNFVLAGMDGIKYSSYELTLNKGDMLYLYTDGVTEATAVAHERKILYGDDRLLDIARKLKNEAPETFCKTILQEVMDFTGSEPQADDITMLAIRFNDTMDISDLADSNEED